MIRSAVVLILAWSTAHATEHAQVSNLAFQCNDNGAVLNKASGETIYLGMSCDAAIPDIGTGRWWYAAGGFIVDVGKQSIRFNSDIPCPKLPYCLP